MGSSGWKGTMSVKGLVFILFLCITVLTALDRLAETILYSE